MIRTMKKYQRTCQMTIEFNLYPDSTTMKGYGKCNKPAKFKNPKPQMGVEYVCGIHARSINRMFERISNSERCLPISRE